VEAALAKINESDVDVYVGDLSAKYTFAQLESFSLYAVAGPGQVRISDGDFDVDEDTYHLGLGAEIPLGAKGYVRPDVRGRRYVDSDIDVTLVDYSVGFGWRF
jgi:opacity protein-like surface antigen